MSITPQRIIEDKHCLIPCPPETCNCRNGNQLAWDLQQIQMGHLPEFDAFELQIQVDLIKALALAASGGPWEAAPTGDAQWTVKPANTKFRFICLTSQGNDEANASYIAAVNPMAVMKLLGTMQRLQKERDAAVLRAGELAKQLRDKQA